MELQPPGLNNDVDKGYKLIKPDVLSVFNIIVYTAQVTFNALSATGDLPWHESGSLNRKRTIADVSDANPTPLTPAGYAFGIWGLIYLLQLIFLMRSSFISSPAQRRSRKTRSSQIFRLKCTFFISCLLNTAWVIVFQLEYLTVACAVLAALEAVLLISWIECYFPDWTLTLLGNVKPGAAEEPHQVSSMCAFKALEYFAINVTFSVYFAWVSGAFLLNVGIIEPLSQTLSFVFLGILGGLGIFTSSVATDIFFPATVCWSTFAIFVESRTKQRRELYSFAEEIELASLAIATSMGAIIILCIFQRIVQNINGAISSSIEKKRRRTVEEALVMRPHV